MGQRVAHIAIAVTDMDEARATWARLLECEPTEPEQLPNQGVISCGFHLDNIVIELVSPLGETSPIANYLARRGAGIHHVAFHTDDLVATLAAKQAQGFQVIPPQEGPGAGGMEVTFLHPKSVSGILVEFVQPPHADPGAVNLGTDHLRAGGHPVDPGAAPSASSGAAEES